jgi:hypothetical protein
VSRVAIPIVLRTLLDAYASFRSLIHDPNHFKARTPPLSFEDINTSNQNISAGGWSSACVYRPTTLSNNKIQGQYFGNEILVSPIDQL